MLYKLTVKRKSPLKNCHFQSSSCYYRQLCSFPPHVGAGKLNASSFRFLLETQAKIEVTAIKPWHVSATSDIDV